MQYRLFVFSSNQYSIWRVLNIIASSNIINPLKLTQRKHGVIMQNIKSESGIDAIDKYILGLPDIRKQRVSQLVKYIRANYEQLEQTVDFAPKTKFPTFKVGGVYVAIGNMKNYLSVHFGRYQAADIVADADIRIKKRVGCVNIPDSVDFPFNELKKAIDFCFKQ